MASRRGRTRTVTPRLIRHAALTIELLSRRCLMVDHQAGYDRKSDESDVQAAGLAPAGPGGVRPPACGRQQELDLLYWGLRALMPSRLSARCEQQESNLLCWGKGGREPPCGQLLACQEVIPFMEESAVAFAEPLIFSIADIVRTF